MYSRQDLKRRRSREGGNPQTHGSGGSRLRGNDMRRGNDMTGMSLLELLLAMTLSLLILALLTGSYLMMEQQRTRQADLQQVHDNARAALQILVREIQAAGYSGCSRLSEHFPFHNASVYPISAENKLQIISGSWGNDIRLWHGEYQTDVLLKPMVYSTVLEVSSRVKMKKGELALISDCFHADLFEIAQVSEEAGRQRILTLKPLSYLYNETADLAQIKINTYSIEDTGRFDERGQPIRSLYLSTYLGQKEEIVEGIQKLQADWVLNDQGARAVSIRLEAAQGIYHKTEFAFVLLKQEARE